MRLKAGLTEYVGSAIAIIKRRFATDGGQMPRPSIFHKPVINYIHAKRGPFSLKEVRDACGIKDAKTSRTIVHRLAAMKYLTYLHNVRIRGNKRWIVTKKWPPEGAAPDEVLDDYATSQLLRRIM